MISLHLVETLLKFKTPHTKRTIISMYRAIDGATFSFRIRNDFILCMVSLHCSVLVIFDESTLSVRKGGLFCTSAN